MLTAPKALFLVAAAGVLLASCAEGPDVALQGAREHATDQPIGDLAPRDPHLLLEMPEDQPLPPAASGVQVVSCAEVDRALGPGLVRHLSTPPSGTREPECYLANITLDRLPGHDMPDTWFVHVIYLPTGMALETADSPTLGTRRR